MSVEFTDNSMKVQEALKQSVSGFLYEVGGELQAQTMRNSRVDTGQTKGSYEYKVVQESNSGTVYVGSNFENAIYEELGTGEYALNGNGRKTPWVYKNRKGDYYRTTGKKPNRPMYNAFNSSRTKIEKRLQQILKQI